MDLDDTFKNSFNKTKIVKLVCSDEKQVVFSLEQVKFLEIINHYIECMFNLYISVFQLLSSLFLKKYKKKSILNIKMN